MPRMRRQSASTLAQRQSVRDAALRVARNHETFTLDFEKSMRELSFRSCSRCLESVESSKLENTECYSCRRSRAQVDIYSAANSMDFGDVPQALQGLSMAEQILIARVNPVVSVFNIRGRQRAYSGHVMNFNQRIERIARTLPELSSLDSIIIMNRQTPHGVAQFKVRSNRVRLALRWLKTSNHYYSDVLIDEELLQELPTDGDISQLIQGAGLVEDDDGSGGNADGLINVSCYPNIPNVDQDESIDRQLRELESDHRQNPIDWPHVSQSALNEFSNEGMVCRAFPHLFPYGRGDISAPRIQPLTYRKYFQHLMEFSDGRFAKDARFPYYAFNTVSRWDALNVGNVYVRNHELDNMTIEDIREAAEGDRLATSIMYYGTKMRGTRGFWKQRSQELLQMVRQIGTPTIFFTLSAADYHWPDLFRILKPGVDPDTITSPERLKLMHENPYQVAKFFDIRVDRYFKKYILKYFKVIDFWYRYEWQHRGSPHIHGVIWIEGSPDCSNLDNMDDDGRSAIAQYFDRLVTALLANEYRDTEGANNPCRRRYSDLSPTERVSDLDRILSTVQVHSRCGPHCMRKRRGSRVQECRYGFPMRVEDQACLRKENGCWQFVPRRNHVTLQRYNSNITQSWRGNTDFSAIVSREAVLHYIAKYATKGEYSSESYSEIQRGVMSRHESTAPAATAVRSLLISSVAERNFSAQEVAHLLQGWPLYRSSRSVVILSLKEDWRRLTRSTEPTSITHYKIRPSSLAGISLFNYVKSYKYSTSHGVTARTKDVILRVIPYIKLTIDPEENEKFYAQQCLLHIPWRERPDESRAQGQSWLDVFLRHEAVIDQAEDFAEGFPRPEEVVYEENPLDHMQIVRGAGEALSRLRPGSQHEDPMGQRPIDESHEWPVESAMGFNSETLKTFFNNLRTAAVTRQAHHVVLDFDRMSREQQEVLRLCMLQLAEQPTAKRILVQGKAGTGKSAVIKSMCRAIEQAYPDDQAYQVLAPTGAAAINVDGKTIHSFLSIPVNGPLEALVGDQLRNFQFRMRHIKFIIIDEYSMIGLRLLTKIHRRLCEAHGVTDQPFGGFNIYFFGDIRQLPPVRDTAFYGEPKDDFSRFGMNLVNNIQKFITLSVCHRQAADQVQFKHALDNMASGKSTLQDWELLMTRRPAVNQGYQQDFANAIHLFATNNQVSAVNNQKLSTNQLPVLLIVAENNNTTARQAKDQAQGMPNELYLSLGCRVMLRKNLNVERGLVNGSLGTVRSIVFKDGEAPPSMPAVVLVEFDDYGGPFLTDNLFPIKPTTARWAERGVDCTRRQFPLTLAYALTIHKSQGLTLDKAIIDIGKREMAAGLSYVALSRVRRITDLILAPFPLTRLQAISKQKHIEERETFLRVKSINS